MTELFVSYCRDDSGAIEPIVENLRRLGFDLWIDIEHLTPGTPTWAQAIDDALNRVDGVLAFLSSSAKQSHWCNIETMRAQTFKKPIYPILLYGDNRTAVPIHLEGIQYTDMRGRADREREFKRLVETLAADLNHELPAHEVNTDQRGQPVINIHAPGYIKGNIYALHVEGDVAGNVNIADGGIAYDRRETTRAKSRNARLPLIIGGGILVIAAIVGGIFSLNALASPSFLDVSHNQSAATITISSTEPTDSSTRVPINTIVPVIEIGPPEDVLGTGDIEVTATWPSKPLVDIDLSIRTPTGSWLNYDQWWVDNGILEWKSNSDCAIQSTAPTEHIYWPDGQALSGTYEVLLEYWPGGYCMDQGPVPVSVRIVVKGETIYDSTVTLIYPGNSSHPLTVTTFEYHTSE